MESSENASGLNLNLDRRTLLKGLGVAGLASAPRLELL